MCANSEGSGETARMRRLAWAFAGRLCDKYHNLMSWLKFMSEQTRSEDVADVLSLILDVGLDINVRDSKTDSSPLEDFLDKLPKVFGSLQYYLQYRQTVELYISAILI